MKKSFFSQIPVRYILIFIFAVIGSIAALYSTFEKIEIYKNPNHVTSCSINSILDCGVTLKSAESEMFGIPISIFGLLLYVATAVFISMLALSKYENNIINLLAAIAYTLAAGFSLYLIYISYYKLGHLCPICLISAYCSINLFYLFILLLKKPNLKGYKYIAIIINVLFITLVSLSYVSLS